MDSDHYDTIDASGAASLAATNTAMPFSRTLIASCNQIAELRVLYCTGYQGPKLPPHGHEKSCYRGSHGSVSFGLVLCAPFLAVSHEA